MFRTIVAATLLTLFSAASMAQMTRKSEGLFERADTNKDGSVTREELLASRNEQFAKFDRNSDGYIDATDIPKRVAMRRQQQGGGAGEVIVGQFDADGDGKVTKEEFVNGPTIIFDRADTDGNSVLDAKELAAAKEAAKAAIHDRRNRAQQP